MPLRLIHFADLHLGVENYGRFDPSTGLNTRLLDFTARYDEVIEHAIAERVDLVVFAGDAFRSRDPSPTQQREFARRIRRLSDAAIPTFLLVGNHDLPAASGRANSLDIYDTLAVPHVTVGRTPRIYRIETRSGPVQIAGLPWLRRSALLARPEFRSLTAEDVRREIQARAAEFVATAAAELEPGVPAILAGHISVEGATYGSERSVRVGEDIVLPRSTLANPAFAYVALGHIHKHQVLGDAPPVVYPGSLERVDFGEEHDPKGFMVVEIDRDRTSYEFRPVAARPFVTIRVRPHTVSPTDEVLRQIERAEIAGAVVRLIVETTPEIDAHIDYLAVRRALKDAFCVAGVRRDVAQPERRGLASSGIEAMTPQDALDLYLKVKELPAERRETLLRYGARLIGETT